MNKDTFELIDVGQLRIGMFIELGVGWMSHPFPRGSFRIASQRQIQIIQGLNLPQVRYFPGKSDLVDPDSAGARAALGVMDPDLTDDTSCELASPRQRALTQLVFQQRSLRQCERRFDESVALYKQMVAQVAAQPQEVGAQSIALINSLLDDLLGPEDSSIRLLSRPACDRIAMHSVNVMVLSLLLGKAMGLSRADLLDLGVAALLHDIGKSQLPERVRCFDVHFSPAEYKVYLDHVTQGVTLARRMGLNQSVQTTVEHHHEMNDGSGVPLHLKGDALALPAKILALVNRYENLCNPAKAGMAMTPHEALSHLFTQKKSRFDGVVLGAFIRMMGVYPPGDIIQLVDERYAVVVAANTARPLKPRVMVHDNQVPRHEALVLDLEQMPELGIRRSVKPQQLPPASADYLLPTQRVSYFFEQAEPALA